MHHLAPHFAVLHFVLPATLFMVAFIEAAVLYLRRPDRVDWKESLATLAIAMGNMLIGLSTHSLMLGLLWWLWSFYRIFTIPLDGPLGFLSLFVASEFFYYWEHRSSHAIRWFWASHRVHHSPEHLNFSAAYRLGWTGTLSGLPILFFVPMVLLGFSPLSVAAMFAINLIYQFWLHNEWMPKLGPLELIFNTPSNHRVHHAKNPQYIDRNFGGMLIVFDRLFGTYATERAACAYGLADGAASYNPVQIALGEWHAIWRDLLCASTWQGKVTVLFSAPRK